MTCKVDEPRSISRLIRGIRHAALIAVIWICCNMYQRFRADFQGFKVAQRQGNRSGKAAPMHVQVRETLAQRIATGVYQVGQMIPSEHELCESFKVSRITIRQALGALATEGLLERHPGRGTFVCERKKNDSGAQKVITLVLANAIGSFMAQVVRGVESEVRAAGYDLHLAISHDSLDEESRLINEVIAKRVAGALLFTCDTEGPVNPNCFQYLRVREAGIPLLLVDRYITSLPVGYVVAADEAGMRKLTEHMISLGHKRIGYMDHDVDVTSVADRRRGYTGALMDHLLHPDVIIRVDKRREKTGDSDLAYQAMKDFLQTHKKLPTAILGCNTYYAIGMMRALKEAGIRVPEDVALAGFDDLPEAAVLEVPLTVLRAPVEEMGRLAAKKLLHLIEKGGTGEDVQIKLPGELIIRESCGKTVAV